MKFKIFKQYYILNHLAFIVPLLLGGCFPMSTLQTARTTSKGYNNFGISIGVADYLNKTDHFSIDYIPILEGSIRHGLTDKSDFGLKITTRGFYSIDYKHMLIGDSLSLIGLSSGVGLSMLLGYYVTSDNFYNLQLPVYFSYHPREWFSYYSSPKYIITSTYVKEGLPSERNKLKWGYYTGITNGLCFGKRNKFLIEYTFYITKEYNSPINQINFGFVF